MDAKALIVGRLDFERPNNNATACYFRNTVRAVVVSNCHAKMVSIPVVVLCW